MAHVIRETRVYMDGVDISAAVFCVDVHLLPGALQTADVTLEIEAVDTDKEGRMHVYLKGAKEGA